MKQDSGKIQRGDWLWVGIKVTSWVLLLYVQRDGKEVMRRERVLAFMQIVLEEGGGGGGWF
jgi:hypothetical protein